MTENEFLKFKGLKSYDKFEGILIEFAKLKCQEQLSSILKNVTMKVKNNIKYLHMNDEQVELDKDSIKNAYNLEENIK